MKGPLMVLGLVFSLTVLMALIIWTFVYPWAELTNDPDAIQGPAFFGLLFLVVIGLATGSAFLYAAWLSISLKRERDRRLSVQGIND
mgnify:CR=1 FL=1